MSKMQSSGRRKFLAQASMGMTAGVFFAAPTTSCAQNQNQATPVDNINIICPKAGYTPQIGTLVSMMNWMRNTILYPVQGMSVKDLDYLHDDNSNSIGAMLWHLAATERFYQINTFDGRPWGNWPAEDRKAWSTPMGLGSKGRKRIKNHPPEFYLEKLETVRANTLKAFAERDDEWLLSVDEDWGWGSTNNYCKWFHVCEHESNHNGQIKWIKSRINT
ncbi:MAG: DinB family protein [Bacteroidota bacterium]